MSHAYGWTASSRSALAITLIAAMSVSVSFAQSTTAPESTELDEVVVTAERREVNLQDVPASATVLTADDLAAKGVDNVIDIQTVAPSVAINTYNRSTFINIRGVGIAQSAPTSNPGVAYYIDGMFIPHEQFIAQIVLRHRQSIEVLRGPQGTLTGQNSTGGAIYVRTPTPKFDGFSGYIDQTVADEDWYRTDGRRERARSARSSPCASPACTTSAAASPTTSVPARAIPAAAAIPRAAPRSATRPPTAITLDLRYEHFDRKTDYNAIKNRNDLVTSDPFTIEEDAISFLNQKGDRASLEARFDLTPGIALRVLSSYLDAETTDQADGDRTATALPVPPNLPTNGANTALFPGRVSFTTQELRTWVSEINLLSHGDGRRCSGWSARSTWMRNSPVSVLRDNRNTVNFVQSNSSIITELDEHLGFGVRTDGLPVRRFVGARRGLRYSEDKQQYTRLADSRVRRRRAASRARSELESDEVTGRLGLKYFATDDVMLYGTVSKGYKAGGINLDPRLPDYEPETNEMGELGIKSTVADGRLRVNGAVFYSDYEGIQLSSLTAVGTPPALLPNTLNAAPAEIYGAELELTGKFDALEFNLGVSSLHGEFTEDALLTDSQTNTNRLVPEGSPVPFAPEFTATAGVQYDIHAGQLDADTARAGVVHR